MPTSSVDAAEGQPANPFVCNVCQKTYGRIDHLARHFRSHTNEKPFRCVECGKTFARADLLKRHATLHTSTEQSGKKRKIRASQACAACATIKVKCDQEKPCRRCQSKGLECRVDSTTSPSISKFEEQPSPPSAWSPQLGAQSTYTSDRQHVDHPHSGYRIPGVNSTPHANLPYPNNGIPIGEDLSLTNFLKDVIYPGEASSIPLQQRTDSTWNGNFAPRDLMDFSQDLSMDFNDLDAVLSGGWDTWLDPCLAPQVVDKQTGQSDVSTPSIDESINMSSAAYSRSAWRWIPNRDKADQDQSLASILVDGHGSNGVAVPPPQFLAQPLNVQDRDRMVALLLASSEKANFQKIVALFPGLKVLDAFLNEYLLNMEHSIDGWIHIPTFRASEVIPELLTLTIAGGAVLGKTSHAQRLGYALQEKARVAIFEMFERDNGASRSLHPLQACSISLDIGTWSGNKRTMELAESSALPLVTMIRRSGGFRRSRGVAVGPSHQDSPDALEQKWRSWVEAESFKRLAYHVFIYCVQVSVAFQIPPLVSYAEITLELPAPAAVWRARSAQEWRDQYVAHGLGTPLPSFATAMQDAHVMGSVRDKIDLELTLYLVLLSHWLLAWDITQLSSVNKAQASTDAQWTGTLLASSKCQELRRLLDSFYVAIEDWNVFVPKEVHMISQLLRMNLCVSFEDLQIIAGKEGEEEARRVLPSLKQWFHSSECREAMGHAGQVLRAARRPPGRSPNAARTTLPDTPWLRDFNAVGLYHAGLAFWVYGFLARAISVEQINGQPAAATQQMPHHPVLPIDYEGPLIRVDGDDEDLKTLDRHHFIGLNKGRAVISVVSPFLRGIAGLSPIPARTEATRASRGPNTEAVNRYQTETVPLDDPKRVMEVIMHALTPSSQPPESNTRSTPQVAGPQRPAMVENLVQLMRDLGEAASAF